MTPDDLRQDIELNVVEIIKAKLADGSLTEERAQSISQYVLDVLKPGMSFEELYKVIPKLDDHFSELAPIVHPLMQDYEKRIVQVAQKSVTDLIRNGQYDAASQLADSAIKQEIKLEWTGSSSQKKT